jgi:hypothetical protein
VAQYLKKNQRKKHQEVLLAHAVSTVQHGTHLLSYLFVLCTLLIPNPASSRKLQTKTTRNKNSSKAEPCLAGTVLGISHSERRAEWWHWCGRRPNKSIGFSWSISSLPSQARRAHILLPGASSGVELDSLPARPLLPLLYPLRLSRDSLMPVHNTTSTTSSFGSLLPQSENCTQ